MMVPPRSNGGSVENEWQPMSALTCMGPISRASNFMDANSGRSGQPVHSPDGRAGTLRANIAAGSSGTERADDFTHDAVTWTLTAHEARPGHEVQFDRMLEGGQSLARAAFASRR